MSFSKCYINIFCWLGSSSLVSVDSTSLYCMNGLYRRPQKEPLYIWKVLQNRSLLLLHHHMPKVGLKHKCIDWKIDLPASVLLPASFTVNAASLQQPMHEKKEPWEATFIISLPSPSTTSYDGLSKGKFCLIVAILCPGGQQMSILAGMTPAEQQWNDRSILIIGIWKKSNKMEWPQLGKRTITFHMILIQIPYVDSIYSQTTNY